MFPVEQDADQNRRDRRPPDLLRRDPGLQAALDLYGISGGSAPPVPVTAFGKFFITEPIDKNDGTIWVELTDIVEPGTSSARGIVQDVIKLFR